MRGIPCTAASVDPVCQSMLDVAFNFGQGPQWASQGTNLINRIGIGGSQVRYQLLTPDGAKVGNIYAFRYVNATRQLLIEDQNGDGKPVSRLQIERIQNPQLKSGSGGPNPFTSWVGMACEVNFNSSRSRSVTDTDGKSVGVLQSYCANLDTYLSQTPATESATMPGYAILLAILQALVGSPSQPPKSTRAQLLTTGWILQQPSLDASAKATKYTDYVAQCKPSSCLVSSNVTPSIVAIVTIALGLIGGVISVIKAVVPFVPDGVLRKLDACIPRCEDPAALSKSVELDTVSSDGSAHVAMPDMTWNLVQTLQQEIASLKLASQAQVTRLASLESMSKPSGQTVATQAETIQQYPSPTGHGTSPAGHPVAPPEHAVVSAVAKAGDYAELDD